MRPDNIYDTFMLLLGLFVVWCFIKLHEKRNEEEAYRLKSKDDDIKKLLEALRDREREVDILKERLR